MPNDVIDAIKQQYPEYQGIHDDLLTAQIADKYPAYKQNLSFAADLERIQSAKPLEEPVAPFEEPPSFSERMQESVGGIEKAVMGPIGKAVALVGNIPAMAYNAAGRLTGKLAPVDMPFEQGKGVMPKAFYDAVHAQSEMMFRTKDVYGMPAAQPTPFSMGMANAIKKTAEGFTTPEGIATLPLLESTIGKVAMGTVMASQTPEQVRNTAKTFADPNSTPTQKWEALGDAGINIAMLAGLAYGLKPAEVKAQFTPEQAAKVAEETHNPPVLEQPPGHIDEIPALQPATEPATPLAVKADAIAPVAPLTSEAVKKVTINLPPLSKLTDEEIKALSLPNGSNPGGAQADLPPEQQAVSKANNSKDVWAGMGFKMPESMTPEERLKLLGVNPEGKPTVTAEEANALPPAASDNLGFAVVKDGEPHGFFKNENHANMVASAIEGAEVKPANPKQIFEDYGNEMKQQEFAAGVQPDLVGEEPPSKPAPFQPAILERSHDIIDSIAEHVGAILNKANSKPSHAPYYEGEGYTKAQSGAGRRAFGSKGQHIDVATEILKGAGDLGHDATPEDLIKAIGNAGDNRRTYNARQLPEQKADAFQKEITKGGKSKQKLSVGDLSIGDKFTLRGEEFEVLNIDADDGSVQVKDGKKFGRQTIPDGADLLVDKDSHKPVEASADFTPTEQPSAPLPTLKSGQKQGDLMVNQTEDFALVGQKAADGDRIQQAKDAAAKVKAEADEIAKKQQQSFTGMGGAVQSEFDRSSNTATSLKNATVDVERSMRGLPPAIQAARKSFGKVWDEAMARIDHDPDTQKHLIEELRDKPRALTDVEDALLLHRQIDLQNEYGKATRDLAQAYDDGRTEAVVQERIRVAGLLDQLTDIYDIGRKAGTESGRGLNARKMLVNEDYSLAKMTMDMRAANEGRPPSVEETVQVQKMHDRIIETQKKLDEYEARVKELESQKAVDEFIKASLEQQRKSAESTANRLGQELTKAKLDALKQPAVKPATGKSPAPKASAPPAMSLGDRIRAMKSGQKPGTLHAFGLVESVYDTLLEGVALAVDGGAKLADAISKAIKDLNITGKWDEGGFRDSLGALEKPDKPEVPLKERVVTGMKKAIDEGESVNDLQRYVQKLAEEHVRNGIKTRDPLIDAVHADLKEVDPNITRRETMDLISGYGDFKKLNMEQTKVELRDLKGQMQQVAKLQDIEAREPIKASGVERAKQSDEHRRLIQQVNEAKKKFGVVVTDPARQLKSALDAIKTRLKNSIKDLEFEIATKQKTVRQKSPAPSDAEVETLRARRDELKRQQQQIFGDRKLTDAQRLKVAMDATKRSVEDYERRIKEKDFASNKNPSVSSPELDALKTRRDALLAEFEELRDLDPKHAEEQARNDLQQRKEALEKSIADKEAKIKAGDTEKSGTKMNRPANPELEELMQRRDALNREITEMRKKPAEQKAAEALQRRVESLQKRIKEKEAMIASGDIAPKGAPANRPMSPELEVERQKLDALNKQINELRNPKVSREESALRSLKRRLANRTAELKEKTANGDFTTKTRKPLALDAEAQRLKVDNANAKLEFQKALVANRMKNRSLPEKVMDTLGKWRRGFLLSGPATLAKLTAAAVERMAFAPIEQAVGHGIGKLIPRVAEKASTEGRFSSKAEARAFTQGLTQGMKDAWTTLKTGHGPLDALYGKPDLVPRTMIDFFGAIHGALKSPTKRNAFERSVQQQAEHYIAKGVDVTDPLVQSRISIQAYNDANRSIFMQDNRVVSAYKRAMSAFEQPDKVTGKVPLGSKALATAAKVFLPIVKVPTNIVAETMQYAVGSVTGSARLANAMRHGMENLSEDQANLIMRDLKKGSLGGALLLTGYFAPNLFGGYYQNGQKRQPGDVKPGTVRLGGHDIPSLLVHNPLLETLQIGATIRRVADERISKKNPQGKGLGEGLMAGGLGLAEAVPFIRQAVQFAKLMDPKDRGFYLRELSKSMTVPALVNFIAEHTDKDRNRTDQFGNPNAHQGQPWVRKATTIPQAISTGIPGLRQTVPIDYKKSYQP